MEDIQILNEERKLYLIGPKKKRLELKMLGISDYYEEFVPEFLMFLNYFIKDSEKIRLPTGKQWGQKKKMATLSSQLRRVFSFRIVRKKFIRLLKKAGYLQFSKRYFNKYVTPTMLVDIFYRVYKFNIDDFKKKLLEVADSILGSSQLSQIYTEPCSTGAGSNRLQGSAGSQKKLKPRFRSLGKSKSPC